MPDYRQAVLEDLPELVGLARQAAADIYPYLPFDADITEEMLEGAILNDNALVYVCDTDAGLSGFVAGEIMLSWFGDGRVASDWVTYAGPCADAWTGYRLHRGFVRWAEDAGVESIVASNFSNLPDARMSEVFHRMGYEFVGSTFRRNPKESKGE